MTIQKNDFVELEFTGKVKDGNIFDTNIKEDAKKAGLDVEVKPLVICVGQHMVVNGFDKALEGKEEGKNYEVEILPHEGFGNRDPKLVRLIPLKAFLAQKIYPEPGMMLTLDNMLVRISSVSGGRVLTDFNNPLSGKNLIYNFIIKRKISSMDEKISALQDFFFRKRLKYETKEGKIVFFCEKTFSKFVELFKPKFKEILSFELEIKEEVKEAESSSDKSEGNQEKKEEKK